MSTFKANEVGIVCSLTKAVEDVAQHGYAQIEAFKKREKTLSSLQVKLSNVENKSAEAQKQLRSKLRELHLVENEVEHLEVQTQLLHDRYASLSADNTELQILVSEEQESASTALASFGVYRNKIEGHRAAVLRAESEMEEEDNKELKEKSEQVRMLTQTKEELEEDLKNPNGNTMQMTMQKEIDLLNDEIAAMKMTVAERTERLGKEADIHTQIKKDIEIQNKHYEAVIKRLRCRLRKAETVNGKMSGDICDIERQIAKIKQQLEFKGLSGQ